MDEYSNGYDSGWANSYGHLQSWALVLGVELGRPLSSEP
jgi:hypothetical protein